MINIAATKEIAKIAVTLSTGFIVGNVIRNNTTPQNIVQQGEIMVGSFVLGSIVADVAAKHTDAQIDNAFAWFASKKESKLHSVK